VLFLGGGGTELLSVAIAAEPLSTDHWQLPEYDRPLNAYPAGVRRKDFEFGLYKLLPAAGRPPKTARVAVGLMDDLEVLRFHARERHGETGDYFRWTGAQSFVLVLGIRADAREVVVWMGDGGRPATAAPPKTEIAIDNEVLGVVTPDRTVRPYSFPLPPALAARAAASPDPVRVRIRVPTWNAATQLGGPDTRDLGVIVTRVEVR
jgi:hypothetical protein